MAESVDNLLVQYCRIEESHFNKLQYTIGILESAKDTLELREYIRNT